MADTAAAPAADHRLMSGAPPFPRPSLVTLANWQDPPFNRWSFQHLRELVPTARVSRAAGQVRRMPRAELDLTEIRFQSGERDLTVGESSSTRMDRAAARPQLSVELIITGGPSRPSMLS
jgi:hypothetical protein